MLKFWKLIRRELPNLPKFTETHQRDAKSNTKLTNKQKSWLFKKEKLVQKFRANLWKTKRGADVSKLTHQFVKQYRESITWQSVKIVLFFKLRPACDVCYLRTLIWNVLCNWIRGKHVESFGVFFWCNWEGFCCLRWWEW